MADLDALNTAFLAFAMLGSAGFSYLKSRNREKERTIRLQSLLAKVSDSNLSKAVAAWGKHEESRATPSILFRVLGRKSVDS
ncbi:hypothetical protein [Paractinoplanes atraurantiacus]|uniref:Uncharacterized protein n=1 Tax=Paractinoplanes atraurantiacus TaxID=1036182 RepID=A0A285FWK1_9ACTN|nr:hypothetical protein [Actinoplanes atraurantiacus]SNY15194.1 hypothetical protein SAMN05421748_1011293 [Actinoplanes atraurantiacus]